MKKIKDKIREIAKIAGDCPENFQTICFEVLLKYYLEENSKDIKQKADTLESDLTPKPTNGEAVEDKTKNQDDLAETDLHVKARRFLEKYSLTVDALNQLFYKENGEILPLYDNLNTTKGSESQIRITLLQCLHSSISTGNFVTGVENARTEARTRKCYDQNNWAGNFTNNEHLFDFEKYSRKITNINLSEEGKSRLADLIKELQ